MGTFRRKYLIVEVYDFDKKPKAEKRIDNYIKKIKLPYRLLFGKFKGIVNGLLVYFMCWDNSKEGWETMEKAQEIRNKFIDFVESVSEGNIMQIKEDYDEDASLSFRTYERRKSLVSGSEGER